MSGLIYHAFDKTNGKSWVGQTWGPLAVRQKKHVSKSSQCRVFRNALLKRPSAFVWTVLTSGLTTQADMDAAEVYWGAFFNVLAPNGYNLFLGRSNGKFSVEARQLLKGRKPWNVGTVGAQTAWNKGQHGIIKTSEKTRLKQSIIKLGKTKSPETRERMRQASFIREAKKREIQQCV